MSLRIKTQLIITKFDDIDKKDRTYIIEKMGTEYYISIEQVTADRIHLEGAALKDIKNVLEDATSEIFVIIRDCVDPSTK